MRTTKEQIADFNAKRHKYIDYVKEANKND